MSGDQREAEQPKKTVEEVARSVGRYQPEAYYFVFEALEYLLGRLDERRHVTGAELSLAIRDLALERFGLLALPVLRTWGVTQTADFGRIVFALVQAGLMSKTDEDDVRDFQNVFDFDEAFAKYRVPAKMDTQAFPSDDAK